MDETVAFQQVQSFKTWRHDANTKMRLAHGTGAGVSGVKGALVCDIEFDWRKRGRKLFMQNIGDAAHFLLAHAPAASVKLFIFLFFYVANP